MCADWVFRMLFAGIAAVRLEHERRKFGPNTDEMGKRIDATIAVKELKAGLKEMKRENGLGGRKTGKDEKKVVKKKLKD